jgi:hypothetical protein
MKPYPILILLSFAALVGCGKTIVMEGDWTCSDNGWVKNGNPSGLKPAEPCGGEFEIKLVDKANPSSEPEVDPDFRITNIGDSPALGDPVASVFPIYAIGCDTYGIGNGKPHTYSKIDFFAAKGEKGSSAILLGTTPAGSAGSGECDLQRDEGAQGSDLEPGKYRIWAVRYIEGKPDKRTADIAIPIVGPN